MEQGTLMILLNLVVGGLIATVVELLKKKLPELSPRATYSISGALAIAATYGIVQFALPTASWEQIVSYAMATLGAAGLTHGEVKHHQEKANGKGIGINGSADH